MKEKVREKRMKVGGKEREMEKEGKFVMMEEEMNERRRNEENAVNESKGRRLGDK